MSQQGRVRVEDYQSHGLGSILVGCLAKAANDHGITSLVAEVLPENHEMINGSVELAPEK